MFSRIAYAQRETWESFRRNLTLTAAEVIAEEVVAEDEAAVADADAATA